MTESFRADLAKFVGVCRVVRGLKNARFGAIGARPGNFNTMRFSEKMLQNYGMSVVTVDFSEILGNAGKLTPPLRIMSRPKVAQFCCTK